MRGAARRAAAALQHAAAAAVPVAVATAVAAAAAAAPASAATATATPASARHRRVAHTASVSLPANPTQVGYQTCNDSVMNRYFLVDKGRVG